MNLRFSLFPERLAEEDTNNSQHSFMSQEKNWQYIFALKNMIMTNQIKIEPISSFTYNQYILFT